MNYSQSVFLINKSARAIACNYENERNGAVQRTVFKTLDQTIKVDDIVVVPTGTRHGFTCVKVVEVDVSVNFDDTTQINWIVGKVDTESHVERLQHENVAIEAIKKAEFEKRRKDLKATMDNYHLNTIKALPIAEMNGNDHQGDLGLDPGETKPAT